MNHNKKFIETLDVNDWQVETDSGWVDIKKIHKTEPYQIWRITTEHFELECADRHLVFDENMFPVYVDELYVGKKIYTKNGLESITSIENYSQEDNMYDLELDDENHRYYTNGILSHNTISTVIYLLWYAMKYPYKEILITSYSDDSAKKNLNDIKTIYENCPMFLKRGIKASNESTIVFDNKSKIYSRPTTSKSARGLSPAIIYCDEFAFIGRGESRQKATALQEEFYAGISPALSTSKGKLFITSTPISETDLFYNIWSNSINRTDIKGLNLSDYYAVAINDEKYSDLNKFITEEDAKEYAKQFLNASIYKVDGLGRNGFGHLFSTWRDMPGRTEEWAANEELTQGTERFQREYNCLDGESMVTVMDEEGHILQLPISLLYKYHMM